MGQEEETAEEVLRDVEMACAEQGDGATATKRDRSGRVSEGLGSSKGTAWEQLGKIEEQKSMQLKPTKRDWETDGASSVGDSSSIWANEHSEAIGGQDDALGRFITRQMSVTQEDWEKYTADLRSAKTGPQPVGARDRGRSICGLPLIDPSSLFYVSWSSLMLLIDLTYTAFLVALSVSFANEDSTWQWLNVCDFAAGFFFVTDVCINFNTAFLITHNLKKKVIWDGREVAKYYITKGTFWIDIVSTAAWVIQVIEVILLEVSGNSTGFAGVVQAVRALRILRLVRVFRRMFVASFGGGAAGGASLPVIGEVSHFTLFAGNLSLSVAIIVNFLGCLWHFTASKEGFDNTWANHYGPWLTQYGDPDADILSHDQVVSVVPGLRRYVTSVYWALTTITTIGYGDVYPWTVTETLITMGVQLTGVLIFGVLIGSITDMLQNASRDARQGQKLRDKLSEIDGWMKSHRVPRKLYRKIVKYYTTVWSKHEEEEQAVFLELPHNLKQQVAWHFNKDIVRRIPLFRDLDEGTLYAIVGKMKPVEVLQGHNIVEAGDDAVEFWVLHEGEVIAIYQHFDVEKYEAPTVLGPTIMLQDKVSALRTWPWTYRAETPCILWSVSFRQLKPLLVASKFIRQSFYQQIQANMSPLMRRHSTLGADSVGPTKSMLMDLQSSALADADGNTEQETSAPPQQEIPHRPSIVKFSTDGKT